MHALERRRQILSLLENQSFLTVEMITAKLDASPATIRRDFAELSRQGLAVRGHGGIHRIDDAPVMGMQPYSQRRVRFADEKNAIAREAANLLTPGDVVIIDGGSTTECLAQYLIPQVRVITNSLPLASTLNEPREGQTQIPEVNMTGGYLYPKGGILLGSQTVKTLKEYNANWALLGASGITRDGVMNSNDLVMDTQREMMERAQKVVILADESKHNKMAMVKVCDLSKIDILITNVQPKGDLAEALSENNVKIIIPK